MKGMPGNDLMQLNSGGNLSRTLIGQYYKGQGPSLPSAPDIKFDPQSYDSLRVVGGGARNAALQTKTTQAANYAQTRNATQAVLPSAATQAISIGANLVGSYVGGLAGNAVAKFLPKNTPAIVRTGVSMVVSTVVTRVVTAVASHVFTAIVAAIFGVPKMLITLLAFILGVPVLHYSWHRFRRRFQGLSPPLRR